MGNDIILLNLRISMFGVTRAIPEGQYEVDADKEITRATKRILECAEYEFLLQLKRRMHRRLQTLALPGQILRAGVYPIAVAMVDTIEKELEDFSVRWGVAVMALGDMWDIRIREIEGKLRGLYNEDDYPLWDKVRTQFGVRWNYFTMNTPSNLASISSRLFQREKAKAQEEWASMVDDVKTGLRVAFKALVDAMVEKLTPGPDGTKKKLTGVDKLLAFVTTFAKQDVANDEELRGLVDNVRGLLEGQDVSRIRKDQSLRELVSERMTSVKVVLDSLVQDAPSRQIMLVD